MSRNEELYTHPPPGPNSESPDTRALGGLVSDNAGRGGARPDEAAGVALAVVVCRVPSYRVARQGAGGQDRGLDLLGCNQVRRAEWVSQAPGLALLGCLAVVAGLPLLDLPSEDSFESSSAETGRDAARHGPADAEITRASEQDSTLLGIGLQRGPERRFRIRLMPCQHDNPVASSPWHICIPHMAPSNVSNGQPANDKPPFLGSRLTDTTASLFPAESSRCGQKAREWGASICPDPC